MSTETIHFENARLAQARRDREVFIVQRAPPGTEDHDKAGPGWWQ